MGQMGTGVKVAIVVATAAAITTVGIVASAKKASAASTQVPTSITIAASDTSLDIGGSSILSATLLDQDGAAISGYPLILMGDGTMTATTDGNGVATWTLTFGTAGTYQIYAQS
jgi:hypothetical protein